MMIRSFLLTVVIALAFLHTALAADSQNLLGGGQVDFSFAPSIVYPPRETSYPQLVIQPDGKILAVGKFSIDTQGSGSRKVYRFLPNGRLDPGFSPYYPVANIRIHEIAVQADGKIIYLYTFNDFENYTTLNVIRLNPDGTADSSFAYTPYYRLSVWSFGILPLPDGKMLISGDFVGRGNFPPRRSMLKINSDGSLDQEFTDNYTAGFASKLYRQPDGKIIAQAYTLRRLNPDGTLDNTFPVYSKVRDSRIASDGKIVFSTLDNGLHRLFPTGEPDPDFNAHPALANFSFDLRPNGEVILMNTVCTNTCRSYFEHLNLNGSFKRSFVSLEAKGQMTISPADQIYIQGEMFVDNKTVGLIRIRSEYTPTRRKALDFDGDGKSDIAVYRPTDGTWYIRFSATGSIGYVRFGIYGDGPVPGDYDGDTIGDIAVYRASKGTWYILRSSDNHVAIVRFGLPADIPVQDDYDGDSKDDIAVFRPSTGVWYRINSSDGSLFARGFGVNSARPVSGDYDGDGKADIAFWRISPLMWPYISSIDGSEVSGPFDFDLSDRAVPADYDGDSRIDRAIWKYYDGSWRGIRSSTHNGIYVQWGSRGDVPVPADYDGDGKDDFAVWRPSTGEWWIGQSSNGVYYSFRFGVAGDIPIPSTFTR